MPDSRSSRPSSAKLPSANFEGVTKEDVELAIIRYYGGENHRFSDSIRYDLLVSGVSYPPKAIFGLAAERVVGRTLVPSDFSGGLGSVCFRKLAELGYSVVPKRPIEELPEDAVEDLIGELPDVISVEVLQSCPLALLGKNNRAPRVGGRRLSRRAKELGDRAEECVFKQLAAQEAAGLIAGLVWLARNGQTPGWDIEYLDLPSRTKRRVEVKGALAASIGTFDLTANELNAALEFGPEYGLAFVTNSGTSRPKVFFLWDVAGWFRENQLVREPIVWNVRRGPVPMADTVAATTT
jgi:hypothetical protein